MGLIHTLRPTFEQKGETKSVSFGQRNRFEILRSRIKASHLPQLAFKENKGTNVPVISRT
jgi:hypothetical protein